MTDCGKTRKTKIAKILSIVPYESESERKEAIESFSRSKMTYQEIENINRPARDLIERAARERDPSGLLTRKIINEFDNTKETAGVY